VLDRLDQYWTEQHGKQKKTQAKNHEQADRRSGTN
jgi:hypothetical protein